MRRRLFVLFVLVAASAACGRAAAQQPMFGAARYRAADTASRPEPEYGGATAAWERALGLPALRTVSLPGGWREIRAWMGFGLIIPNELVRVVQAPDTVAGRLVLLWNRPAYADTAAWFAGFEANTRRLYGCPAILTGAASGSGEARSDEGDGRACVASRPTRFDWRGLRDSLDALGVRQIRNESKLDCVGVDGVTLVVELLDGADYRTWCYVLGSSLLEEARPIARLLQDVPGAFADTAAPAGADSVARAEEAAGRRRQAWPPADFKRDAADSSLVWIAQHADSTTAFRGLSAPSDTVVWASGSGGVIVRSVDGGRSWATYRIPGADSLFLVDVSAFDARTAVVLGTRFSGGSARIFRTDDGGSTWRVLYADNRPGAFYDGLACWDAGHCVAFGDAVDGRLTIVRTGDGAHWRRVTGAAVPAALPGEAGFAASGTAIAVAGTRRAWIGTGGGDHARVYRTEDGGRTWQVSDTPLPAGQSAGIFGIAFRDTLHGLAVGGDYTKADDPAANVLRTDDGGRTWRLSGSTAPPGVKWGLAAVPGMKDAYVAVSPAGTGFTTDGGATWTAIEGGGYNTVVFASPAAGWAAGSGGRIARASNAPHP